MPPLNLNTRPAFKRPFGLNTPAHASFSALNIPDEYPDDTFNEVTEKFKKNRPLLEILRFDFFPKNGMDSTVRTNGTEQTEAQLLKELKKASNFPADDFTQTKPISKKEASRFKVFQGLFKWKAN